MEATEWGGREGTKEERFRVNEQIRPTEKHEKFKERQTEKG